MNTLTIARKEMSSYFRSPIAYGVMTIFAVIAGYFFYASVVYFVRRGIESSMMGQSFPMDMNEFVVRPLFSNIGVIALFLIWRIAARLIHPDAGWFTVFACLALRGFNDQAADARPYALGSCVLCVSVWLLIRWLDSNRWLDGLLFAGCASLLWRIHLVFWPVLELG